MHCVLVVLCCLWISSTDARRRIIFKATETSDCGGSNSLIEFKSSSLTPSTILNPGNVYISAEMNLKQNISLNGVRLKLRLNKLEPRRMRVPCFRRFGSCSYDVCQMIFDYPETICPMFPSGINCDCEAPAGTFVSNRTPMKLPNFGRMFHRIMQGNYEGNATFVDRSGTTIGCLQLLFSIKNRT